MGNCCSAEEDKKKSAFSGFDKASSGEYTDESTKFGNNRLQFPSNSKSSNIPGESGYGSLHPNQQQNSSNNANDPNSHVDSIQLEEQQRALQQEQERLERIVNDAGRHMVHVNGGVGMRSGGMANGMGYYDANYAAEVWQYLIPGTARGGGGLIARCREFEVRQKSSDSISLQHIPKGGLRDGQHVLEALRSNRKEMELLVADDRVEQFLASVFQEEGGFQDFNSGHPIVEYVL